MSVPLLPAILGVTMTALLTFALGRYFASRSEQGRQQAAQRREVATIVREHQASLLAWADDALAGRRGKTTPLPREALPTITSEAVVNRPEVTSNEWAESFAQAVFSASLSLPKADQDRVFFMMTALVGPMGARLCRDHAALPQEQRGEFTRSNWIRARLVARQLTADDLFQRGSLINALHRARHNQGDSRRTALTTARTDALEGFDNLLRVLR
ncbi:hypothetical protein AB0877_16615 [Micromonospora sp. NPDC047644]|uniref:hypothetical protein n=1 Tax=Micromonospora sp. NPDC047644 TaxID=3157203 RepID=UPI003455C2AC